MKEQYTNNIPLEGITEQAFSSVLKFIYTGKITLSVEDIAEVLHVADMMQIHGNCFSICVR